MEYPEIFIPSRGRADRQPTLEYVHEYAECTLVVPCAEHEEYLDKWGKYATILSSRDADEGISAKRQFISDIAGPKMLMFDDDLDFAVRTQWEPARFRKATGEEIGKMIQDLWDKLDERAHMGVAIREGANFYIGPYIENNRILRVHGFRNDILKKEGVRFDRVPLMQDFYVTLHLLSLGYANARINYMVNNQRGSNTAGGCSTYRTPELHRKAAHMVHDAFPDFTKLVERETKTAWGGGKRIDIRGYWKKAYNSALWKEVTPVEKH